MSFLFKLVFTELRLFAAESSVTGGHLAEIQIESFPLWFCPLESSPCSLTLFAKPFGCDQIILLPLLQTHAALLLLLP